MPSRTNREAQKESVAIVNKVADWLLGTAAAFVCVEAVRYFLAGGQRGRFHVESPVFILVALCLLSLASGCRQSEATRAPSHVPVWAALAALGVAWALYFPALSLGFLSDDFVLRQRALAGEAFAWSSQRFWRPLPTLLFGVLSPTSFHLLNVSLHAVNAWLVACLSTRVGGSRADALVAGALFLSFPAAAEAVVWCSGIQDVLLTTLALSFVLSWRFEVSVVMRAASAGALLCGALLTKETAAVLPALAAVAWTRKPWRRGDLLLMLGTTLASGAYALARLNIGLVPEAYEQRLSLGIPKELVARVFALLAAPWHRDLGLYAGLGIVAGLFLPVLLVLATQRWREDCDALGRALRMTLWILISVAPAYSLFYVAPDLQGSRYAYLAAAGWSIVLSTLMASASSRLGVPRLGLALAAAIVAVGAAGLYGHLGPWREAALLRDRVLLSATSELDQHSCARATFNELPDSVRGAYVFRNGFAEALGEIPRRTSGSDDCRFRWNGGSFERIDERRQ